MGLRASVRSMSVPSLVLEYYHDRDLLACYHAIITGLDRVDAQSIRLRTRSWYFEFEFDGPIFLFL